jgi:hypothetical protein
VIILYTNIGLSRRTGTEIVTADLARTMKTRGYEPIVYSPSLGVVAGELEAAGIPVVGNLAHLSAVPDVIHGHHHYETIQAIQRFPDVPALFVCHDVTAWHDEVPRHPNIRCFVAVGLNARRRLIRDWPQTRPRIEIIGNGVDMARFLPRSPLPAVPRRALVFSNDAGDDSHWEPVAEACRKVGIEVDRVGLASGNQVCAPEKLLPDYDLVFAKGRCAFEAAAVGAAVILCDIQGLGQMVTSRNVGRLRAWNFGMRTLNRPIDPALIVEEIRRYNAGDAAKVRDFIQVSASLTCAVDRYLDVYQRLRAEGVPSAFRMAPRRAIRRQGGWKHRTRPGSKSNLKGPRGKYAPARGSRYNCASAAGLLSRWLHPRRGPPCFSIAGMRRIPIGRCRWKRRAASCNRRCVPTLRRDIPFG